MNTIPPDVLRMSFNYLNDPDLAAACMTNKNFAESVCNNTFWINKIREKFNLPLDIMKESKGNNTYWAYYLNLLEHDVTEHDFLKRAIEMGRKDLVLLTLASDVDGYYANADGNLNSFYGRYVAKNGNLDMLQFLEKVGMKIYDMHMFVLAIEHGHNDIVEYLLDNGDFTERELIKLLVKTVIFGDNDMLKIVLKHDVVKVTDNALHWAFHTKYRDRKKVEMLLKKGEDTISDAAILDAIRNLDNFKKKDRKKLRKILNKIKEKRGI